MRSVTPNASVHRPGEAGDARPVAGPVQRRAGCHCLPCSVAKPKMTSSNDAASQAAHRAFAPSTNLIAARTITAEKTNDQGKNFGLSCAMTGNPAATRMSKPATRDGKRRRCMRGSSSGSSTKMRNNMNMIPAIKRTTVATRNAATTSASTGYDAQLEIAIPLTGYFPSN